MKDKYHIWQFLVINNSILHQKNLKNLIKNLFSLNFQKVHQTIRIYFAKLQKNIGFYLRRFTVCMYGLFKLLQLSS